MKYYLIIVLALCFGMLSFGQDHVKDLIWSDEFNDGSLDLTKWSYETGGGVDGQWGTGQLDWATDRTENVSFQNDIAGADTGCLVITTREEQMSGREYTSGRVRSAGKASWGPGHRIVTRVLPRDVKYKGQGFAFWMMPDEKPSNVSSLMWPQGGEIDIMEYVGSIPYQNLGTVHYAWFWMDNQWVDCNHGMKGGYYNYEEQQGVLVADNPDYTTVPPAADDVNSGSTDFHTYGIDYFNNRIEFFVDDNVYHIHYKNDGGGSEHGFIVDGEDEEADATIDGKKVFVSEYSHHFNEWFPFNHNMYAILSAGVGGADDRTYGGRIVDDAIFPCSVFVDWVRVYEIEDDSELILPQEPTEPTAMENVKVHQAYKINMYPNPVSEVLTININPQKNNSLLIRDITGKAIYYEQNFTSGNIDFTQFNKGAYMVIVKNDDLSISEVIVKK